MDIDIIGKLYDWTLFTCKKFVWIIFQESCNVPNLENQCILHFEFHCQKLVRLYHNTYILLFCIDLSTKLCWGFWFNRTHLLLFQNMTIKVYTIFFLSSGGYNFKINYLKDKIRHVMRVHIVLNNLVSSPLQHRYYFWHRRSKCYEKAVKFHPEMFEFNFFVQSNN